MSGQQPYDTSGDTACTELTCPAHGELNRLRAELARKDETLLEVRALGEAWVGFDDCHPYGGAVLSVLAEGADGEQ